MARIAGSTGAYQEVDAAGNAFHKLPGVSATGVPFGGGAAAGHTVQSENDQGLLTGLRLVRSPRTDADNRLRIAPDLILDDETFNYTAQNTGKHSYLTTTMTNTWTAGQLTSNATSITTTTTGTVFQTYAYFPCNGDQTLEADTQLAFSAQPQTNSIIEWGFGLPGAQTVAPTDGVFFRLNSAGLQGIASYNGAETSTGVFPLALGAGTWAYINAVRNQFKVQFSPTEVLFYVNTGTGLQLLGTIPLPVAQARFCMSAALPYFYKHRITGGAASGVLQGLLGAYTVRQGGQNNISTVGAAGNRQYGSGQGLSGGTMGSLANYANSANPAAAVPTNTTAALGTGLGGQFWETATLAVNTDGIICSFQNPAGTVNVQGRRLVIYGISLASYVQTVVAGGPYNVQYSLAYGHTAVSLATAEAAAAKAPRRRALPQLTQLVTAAQAVNTMVLQPQGAYVPFAEGPIYVNPGEFVALVSKHVGTVGSAGTIAHMIDFNYGWE